MRRVSIDRDLTTLQQRFVIRAVVLSVRREAMALMQQPLNNVLFFWVLVRARTTLGIIIIELGIGV